MDASSVEALACVGQHHYYADAPELAVRVYQRLLLMGVGGAALWNNLALGCTASGQVDLALGCVQRALETVGHVDSSEGSGATSNSGGEEADVWYNVGHVALGIGDVTLAYQAFKVALAADPGHAEAATNLGVLEVRRGRMDAAKSLFETAVEAAPQGWEARFNLALLLWRAGDYAGAFGQVRAVLNVYPQHPESLELMAMLRGYFVAL
jgi:tetratricopeptide repeat protein 8